jgi:hypothetical protein
MFNALRPAIITSVMNVRWALSDLERLVWLHCVLVLCRRAITDADDFRQDGSLTVFELSALWSAGFRR